MTNETVVAHICSKGNGHIDTEGVCSSHWAAEIVIRPITDYEWTPRYEHLDFEAFAKEIRNALDAEIYKEVR